MRIGEKLKEGRVSKGMTQENVSKILHVSRSTISSWEVNRTYPDLDLLVAMSNLYDLSLDIILREDNKIVENIVNETKKSKKRKGWIAALLIIFIPIILFLSYLLWSTGLVMSVNQIDNVKFELNGDDLSSKSQIILDVELDDFHEYSGYWGEISPEKDTIIVQLYQSFSLSGNKQEMVTIPMDLLEHVEFPDEIKKIEINGFSSSDTKMIYFKKE